MSSAHVIRVKKLYRHGLKCLHNWTVHRDLYISKGFELRAEFDAQKLVTNPSVVEKLVSDGEAKLVTYAHPSPYTRALPPAHTARMRRTHCGNHHAPRSLASVPTMPGGTKYQRHPNNNLGWSPEVRNSPIAVPHHSPPRSWLACAPRGLATRPFRPSLRPAQLSKPNTLDRLLVRPVVRHPELLQVSWPLRWLVFVRLRAAPRAAGPSAVVSV